MTRNFKIKFANTKYNVNVHQKYGLLFLSIYFLNVVID